MKAKHYLLVLFYCLIALQVSAQKGNNEFERKRLYCDLDATGSDTLVSVLNQSDGTIFKRLKWVMDPTNNSLSTPGYSPYLTNFKSELKTAFSEVQEDDKTVVILMYRSMKHTPGGNFTADLSDVKIKIFHKISVDSSNKSQIDTTFSSYLLAVKKIYVILVDQSDAYYQTTGSDDIDKKLSSTVFTINYHPNHFKQSGSALFKVWGAMGLAPAATLGVTLVEIEPSRIKSPCDLIASNKSFKEDKTFTIHEKNAASFQVGVTNGKLNYNNVSITGGNLVVKPGDDDAKEWKSNAYALLELHVPRDIDNFRPLWTTIAKKLPGQKKKRTFGDWLYDVTIDRMGIYGGVKLSKDPLSNLYAGLNYAITKELAFNFGYVWVNDYATQVTDIGSISSVNDALKYAKRRYSGGKLSLGLSFTPTAFMTTLGLKSKTADSGK